MHPDSRHVPVLIGSVPRCDQTETYMRYCRLMLILFKPWRNAFDLPTANKPWMVAFDEFQHSALCPLEFKGIMDNMQLLHECKDSHDDHFQKQRQRI